MPTASELQAILPRWRSHKVVHAGQITKFVWSGAALTLHLRAADGTDAEVQIEPAVTSRYQPVVGDYLLVYEDGYLSVSPREAFESGYDRIWTGLPAGGIPPSQDDGAAEKLPMWQQPE